MKITKSLLAAAGIAMMGSTFTSCLDSADNNGLESTQNFTSFINAVFEDYDDEPTYFFGVGYQAVWNFTTGGIKLQIDGLTLPSGTYSTLKMDDLTWTYSYGWRKVTVPSIIPSSAIAAPTLTNFNFDVMDRAVYQGNTYYPCIKIDYTANGSYYVVSLPSGVINEGTTTVTNNKSNAQYVTTLESALYPTYAMQLAASTNVNLNNASERKASLTIANLQFEASGQQLNFIIKDIPYDVERNGMVTFELSEAQLQSVTGSGSSSVTSNYKDYKVTGLEGTTNSANFMVLNLTISSEQDDVSYSISTQCQTPVVTN